MSYEYASELREWERERASDKEVRDAEIERKKLAVKHLRHMIADEIRWRKKGPFGKKYQLKWDRGEVKLEEKYDKQKIKYDKVEPWRTGYMKNAVFHVRLSEAGESMAVLFPSLRYDFSAVMLLMYRMVFEYVRRHQEQKIPSDTGALRRSLMRNLTLNRRYVGSGEIIMELGSPLDYLRYVNEMPTYPRGLTQTMVEELGITETAGGRGPHLRHPPHLATHRFSKRGGTLYDPHAIHHFMEEIVTQTRAQSERFFREALTRFGFYSRWRDVFGWTHYSQMYRLFQRRRW